MASAPRRVTLGVMNQRLTPIAMETRGVVADWVRASGEVTLYTSTQVPHFVRTFVGVVCGTSEAKVRVVAPDVGGGFGSKLNCYAEEFAACAASRAVGVPVKWIEDRTRERRRDHPRPRPAAGVRGRRRRERPRPRPAPQRDPEQRRLPAAADAVDLPPDPVHGARLLRHLAGLDLDPPGVHQHDADRRLPRRRPAGGHARHRAADGRASPTTSGSTRPTCGAATSSRRVPAHHRHAASSYDSGDYGKALDRALEHRRLRGLRVPPQGGVRARRVPRHRAQHLRRDLRPRAARGRPRRSASAPAAGRAPPCACTRPARSTVITGSSPHGQGHATSWSQIVADGARRAVRGRRGHPRRHGVRALRPRHLRLALAGRRPASRCTARSARSRTRRGCSPPTCWRRRPTTSSACDGALASRARPTAPRRSRSSACAAWTAARPARRHGAQPRGDDLLRPAELLVPVRHPHLRGRGRRGDRAGLDRALRRRRRLRHGHQPDDRRRPGARRHRPGHRPGAVRGDGLRRGRAAADADARASTGCRRAAGPAVDRARPHRHAVARPTRSASRASARRARSRASAAVVNAVVDALSPLGIATWRCRCSRRASGTPCAEAVGGDR